MNLAASPAPAYFDADDCQLDELIALCEQPLDPAEAPTAADIARNIPIYDGDIVRQHADGGPAQRRALMAEWAALLARGPGAIVIRQAQPDLAAIDAATACYNGQIAAEKAGNGVAADHFAAAGSNDRLWNSLQKLALADPAVFVRYFGCRAIDLVCEAWLGPNYQMTAQVNIVRPGGAAQQPHRDYHLGFQTAEVAALYPAHIHDLSPMMTLQGGLAHVDIPVDAGPTQLLPFSQAYRAGYVAWRREDFREYFRQHYVQLPLKKGDAVFFNPALLHAGGDNRSPDVQRFVNLLQVSTAFGRAMESIDRSAMCKALYPALQAADAMHAGDREAAIAASAEGYSFPTNLDTDPPVGGLAPKTLAALVRQALAEGWSERALGEALDQLTARQGA